MDGEHWLVDLKILYRKHKEDCESAVAQVSEEQFFARVGGIPHSIAVLMKHMGENHRSRWRDFLESDGEKPDRDREGEFATEGETHESILAKWQEGWRTAEQSLGALTPADLERTITIRGEPLTVVQAIHRNLAHVAYHTGQLVLLARHFAGDSWQTLSIAPGKTDDYNAAMRRKYGDWE